MRRPGSRPSKPCARGSRPARAVRSCSSGSASAGCRGRVPSSQAGRASRRAGGSSSTGSRRASKRQGSSSWEVAAASPVPTWRPRLRASGSSASRGRRRSRRPRERRSRRCIRARSCSKGCSRSGSMTRWRPSAAASSSSSSTGSAARKGSRSWSGGCSPCSARTGTLVVDDVRVTREFHRAWRQATAGHWSLDLGRMGISSARPGPARSLAPLTGIWLARKPLPTV